MKDTSFATAHSALSTCHVVGKFPRNSLRATCACSIMAVMTLAEAGDTVCGRKHKKPVTIDNWADLLQTVPVKAAPRRRIMTAATLRLLRPQRQSCIPTACPCVCTRRSVSKPNETHCLRKAAAATRSLPVLSEDRSGLQAASGDASKCHNACDGQACTRLWLQHDSQSYKLLKPAACSESYRRHQQNLK